MIGLSFWLGSVTIIGMRVALEAAANGLADMAGDEPISGVAVEATPVVISIVLEHCERGAALK